MPNNFLKHFSISAATLNQLIIHLVALLIKKKKLCFFLSRLKRMFSCLDRKLHKSIIKPVTRHGLGHR